jgi:two-component system response regulator HupR/HoxA
MTAAPPVVLVVDDEVRSQEALRRTLEEDFTVLTAGSADEAAAVMAREFVHILLCDQRMPGTSGVDFLKQVRVQWPDTVRIIISGFTEAEDIIAGINEAGIWQYILKPWHPEQLLLTMRGAAELWRLQQANQRLTLELRASPEVLKKSVKEKQGRARAEAAFSRLARSAQSPLNDVCRLAERVAPHEMSILITGESGTGKELIARAVHAHSPRKGRPFLPINCAAIPENLLESELFGYARGAHSTANADRHGLFVEAHGGTLFLDEIAELPLPLQPKLLRVLQDGEVRPLGSNRAERADVRVIAATNRDLERALREGRFREDLYYRLNVIQLHLPPLRGRQEDILALADHFLLRSAGRSAKPVRGWRESAKKLLLAYHWPGNVRELENVVERAVALAETDLIGPDDLPRAMQERKGQDLLSNAVAQGFTLDQLEREFIERVLDLEGGNKTRAAQRLGLDRKTLYRKLEEYAASPRDGAPPPANEGEPT